MLASLTCHVPPTLCLPFNCMSELALWCCRLLWLLSGSNPMSPALLPTCWIAKHNPPPRPTLQLRIWIFNFNPCTTIPFCYRSIIWQTGSHLFLWDSFSFLVRNIFLTEMFYFFHPVRMNFSIFVSKDLLTNQIVNKECSFLWATKDKLHFCL